MTWRVLEVIEKCSTMQIEPSRKKLGSRVSRKFMRLESTTQKKSHPNRFQQPPKTIVPHFHTMDFNTLLAKVPNSLLVGFAAVGLFAVSSKIVSYIRLLLSLFVLSGKNVRAPTTPMSLQLLICLTASSIRQKGHLGCHYWRLRRNWKGICHPACAEGFQPPACLPHAIKARHPPPGNRTQICGLSSQGQGPVNGFRQR